MIAPLLQWLATLGAGLFTTWALYVSLVEHPARLEAGAPAARAQFRASYRRAAPWQVAWAALALLAGLAAAGVTARWAWAIGGVVVAAAIPFTLLVIMPVNSRLLGADALADEQTLALLRLWGRLHWVRTLLGFAGLAVMLTSVHG